LLIEAEGGVILKKEEEEEVTTAEIQPSLRAPQSARQQQHCASGNREQPEVQAGL
jgi:hypothetical protein